MSEELISIVDIAKQIGKRRQSVFKVIKRHGIEMRKLRGPDSRGQLISYITKDEYLQIKGDLESTSDSDIETYQGGGTDVGVFYLIQLEPEHDPGRYKVGFAVNMAERLRTHRCSAPFSTVIKTWPCKLLWEKTAIDCISAKCEKLHTEVFRTDSIDDVIVRCDQFFSLMPSLLDEE